jgi:type II secretory pathway pseudopilin PulG
VELVFVISVVIVLMALTAVTVGGAIKSARISSERYYVSSLRMGVEQFKQAFGFYPPLVDFVAGDTVFVNDNLEVPDNPRYSVYSLPVYLLGSGGVALDGYTGPGQARPLENGTWDRASPKVEPFLDPSRDAERVRPFGGFSTLVDRWGRAIRYYRWEPTLEPKYLAGGVINPAVGEIQTHNIPRALYDAGEDTWVQDRNSAAGRRSGNFAIVSGGPDGVISDAPSTNPEWQVFNKDNIVEIGQ